MSIHWALLIEYVSRKTLKQALSADESVLPFFDESSRFFVAKEHLPGRF